MILQNQSSQRITSETSSNVQNEDIKNQVTGSVDNYKYLAAKDDGRARLSVRHSDDLFSILQHVASGREKEGGSRTSEIHDYHSTNDDGRGNLRATHSDTIISILQYASNDLESVRIIRNAADHTDTPLIQSDLAVI